jgi:hypothetical protein
MTIVGTSVLSMANYLDGFGQSSWVITAYLCTYIGKAASPAGDYFSCTYSNLVHSWLDDLGKTE